MADGGNTNIPYPPPTGFRIHHANEFATFMFDEEPENLEMATLVNCTPAGQLSGTFRVILGGPGPIRATFKADRMLDVSAASDYTLTLERRPELITFRYNGITSEWIDVDQRKNLVLR